MANILISIIGEAATAAAEATPEITQQPVVASNAALSVLLGALPTDVTTSNALSILLGALPDSVATSFESEYHIGSTPTTTLDTTRHQTSKAQSTSYLTRTTKRTSSPSIDMTSSATFSTATRSMSSISSTSSLPPATSTEAPPADPQLNGGSIAGIVSGVTAGAILIMLAVFFLVRRRKQGKATFIRQSSLQSARAYPEVAWLYDPPAPSQRPQGNYGRSSPFPQHRPQRDGAVGMPQMRERDYSPDHFPFPDADSPLLQAHVPPAGRARGGSSGNAWAQIPARSATNSPSQQRVFLGDNRALEGS